MTETPLTQPPLQTELHPDIERRLRELESTQSKHAAEIDHWKNIAKDAVKVAMEVHKAMRAHPAYGGGSWIRNALAIGGLVSLAVGCWWLEPAASLIVVGSIALGLVIFGAIGRHKMERERVRSDS